jgi:hypothetical protein
MAACNHSWVAMSTTQKGTWVHTRYQCAMCGQPKTESVQMPLQRLTQDPRRPLKKRPPRGVPRRAAEKGTPRAETGARFPNGGYRPPRHGRGGTRRPRAKTQARGPCAETPPDRFTTMRRARGLSAQAGNRG